MREDLHEQPLPDGEVLFVDGSSRVVEGKQVSGSAIVDGKSMQVVEEGKLLAKWSAQNCGIFALKRGLKLLEGERAPVFTDSRYAYGVAHTYGKIRQERGFLNLKGKNLIHESLVKEVLEKVKSPEGIAIVHIRGHQKGDINRSEREQPSR